MNERRRYFRINDSLGVYYAKLGDEEAKLFAEQLSRGGLGVDFVSNFDNRIHSLMEAVKVQSPVAAELVDLLNKKLNFVIRQLDIDAELVQRVAYTLRQVNVSACGLAFTGIEALEPGQMLQLDLMLHPADLHVAALAKVVSCEPVPCEQGEEGERYFLRIDFEEITSHDQELLIQHIVKRQSALLRSRRDESETG